MLLHVGTLRPIKGIDYILNAYAALDDEAKNKSVLIFVGKGQETFYKNIAKSLGINVYFLGEKSNPLDYITLADAVINVSGGSGVSNSLLERRLWENLLLLGII
ncbi:glycosyltransferase family 4 protein [Colwellia sp. MSW7]|uniref:Glycosyltransferase family 4 protein n=1 Tax=Colwellia maritima TaxID=2912588 RepID=A0ABS9X4G2_9GAMM|nr:glycosyltransferase family 4 protein [Colwellia maritima]